jgi:hypothetical protein
MNKRDWHEQMRDRACSLAGGICQQCGRSALGYDGVIHHLKYLPECYNRTVEDLMREKVCVWLCRACHDTIHIAENHAEAMADHRKTGGYCRCCGELEFGIWDRARTLKIDYPLCRKCLRARQRSGKESAAGQLDLISANSESESRLGHAGPIRRHYGRRAR